MRYAISFFTVVFLAGCNAAYPASVSTKLGSIQPYNGVYYDPQQSGSGLEVDTGPNSFMFMTFETYDSSGNQVNLITQPTYVPSSEADLISGKGIGTANGLFYQTTGGQCPGCPYSAPTVTATTLQASFVWTDPRHVTMTFGTSIYHFVAGNFEGKDDGEFLPGTWAVALVNDNSVYPGQGPQYQNTLPTALSVIKVVPATFPASQLVRDPGSSADVGLPPSSATLYVLTCAGNQDGTDDAACNEIELIWTNAVPGSRQQSIPRGTALALLWYDSASLAGGMDIIRPQSDGTVVLGPANFHGQLLIEPDVIHVHLVGQGPPNIAAVTDGIDGVALTFARLPATAVRDCFDYPSTSACN